MSVRLCGDAGDEEAGDAGETGDVVRGRLWSRCRWCRGACDVRPPPVVIERGRPLNVIL